MELHPKQIEAVAKSPKIVWWEMGEGKSRIALAIYDRIQFLRAGICLIVCRKKAFDTWRDEILKVGMDANIQEFPPKKGHAPFISPKRKTIWLVSHAMLHKVLNEFKSYVIHFVIYDELYLYSNHKSKRSVAASKLTEHVQGRCIGLSGTIMPARDTLAIWGQSLCVGLSGYLAKGISDFYNKYKKSFLVDYGRGECQQWIDLPKAKERILDKLSPYTHINFPKSKRSIVEAFTEVDLTPAQLNAIKSLKDEYYLSIEESGFEIELRSALSLVLKVSQIADGWIKDSEGHIATFPSKKLDSLCSTLDEAVACKQQAIVWCHFRHDLQIIQENLDFEVLEMSGDTPLDRDKWKSRKYPVVLATQGSGSSINDFKDVRHAYFFSYTFKHLDFTQSKARTNRFDSSHSSCSYTYFISRKTFDRHIYNLLNKTASVEKAFIERGIIKQWLNL